MNDPPATLIRYHCAKCDRRYWRSFDAKPIVCRECGATLKADSPSEKRAEKKRKL